MKTYKLSKLFRFTILISALFIYSCTEKSNQNETISSDLEPKDHNHHISETIIALNQAQLKAVNIEFGNIENKELNATIRANGILTVPNNYKGNVTSIYGGVVKTLNITEGDKVSKGQVIATLANPQFIQLQEEYLAVNSKIQYAEQEHNRQKELNEGNAGSLKNLQIANSELQALISRRAALKSQFQLMGIDPNSISASKILTTFAVVSPINGVISNLIAKIGSYVESSIPIAEIVDNGSLHLDLHIFEKDLPMLKTGQIIHFTLTNNPIREYDAEIYSIGTTFENESKTITVHAHIVGNKEGLIDGMNITGVVSLDKATSPTVPDNAIVESAGKYYIFIVKNTKTEHNQLHTYFERIEVIKGVSDMGYTAITPITDIPANTKIASKNAFFINARLTNSGEHEH